MTILADGNQLHKFLKNSGFYQNVRNLPIAQAALTSGYLGCLSELGNWSFLWAWQWGSSFVVPNDIGEGR